MAKPTNQNDTTPVPSKSKFTESLLKISTKYPVSKVFDDFLTISIALCTQNPNTKLSRYEDEYLETINYYKDAELKEEFAKAFAYLVREMDDRVGSLDGNDILGEFFETHVTKDRSFLPFSDYHAIATVITAADGPSLNIFDPSCGPGRVFLAAHRISRKNREYYGIDTDMICAKMAALNLFLNGIWNSEVMCGDIHKPDGFVISYRVSYAPLGILKITDKERSRPWQLQKNISE